MLLFAACERRSPTSRRRRCRDRIRALRTGWRARARAPADRLEPEHDRGRRAASSAQVQGDLARRWATLKPVLSPAPRAARAAGSTIATSDHSDSLEHRRAVTTACGTFHRHRGSRAGPPRSTSASNAAAPSTSPARVVAGQHGRGGGAGPRSRSRVRNRDRRRHERKERHDAEPAARGGHGQHPERRHRALTDATTERAAAPSQRTHARRANSSLSMRDRRKVNRRSPASGPSRPPPRTPVIRAATGLRRAGRRRGRGQRVTSCADPARGTRSAIAATTSAVRRRSAPARRRARPSGRARLGDRPAVGEPPAATRAPHAR